jgi:hypothetical protein
MFYLITLIFLYTLVSKTYKQIHIVGRLCEYLAGSGIDFIKDMFSTLITENPILLCEYVCIQDSLVSEVNSKSDQFKGFNL